MMGAMCDVDLFGGSLRRACVSASPVWTSRASPICTWCRASPPICERAKVMG